MNQGTFQVPLLLWRRKIFVRYQLSRHFVCCEILYVIRVLLSEGDRSIKSELYTPNSIERSKIIFLSLKLFFFYHNILNN